MAVIESLPLPTAKKLMQTSPFAEAISHLSVTKLPQLARYLDALLTLEQQSKLLQICIKVKNSKSQMS